ncbi:cytochrome c oxidase assembly protein COX20, mitochondrial isoform X2 [Microcebus murinus]|uniref:cytochrome c oxidase assembly protein COX20, mitochondrial isoform X2 n=1 Tax=Microcebus murinus TaxID=30608 RepID=UPI003F6A590F
MAVGATEGAGAGRGRLAAPGSARPRPAPPGSFAGPPPPSLPAPWPAAALGRSVARSSEQRGWQRTRRPAREAAAENEEHSLRWRPARGAGGAGRGGAGRVSAPAASAGTGEAAGGGAGAPTRPHGRRSGARRAREGEERGSCYVAQAEFELQDQVILSRSWDYSHLSS